MERMREQTAQNPDADFNLLTEGKLTRREFILSFAAILASFALLGKDIEEQIVDFSEDLREHPNTRFYYHNAASNPDIFRKALKSTTPNIEIDVVSYQDKLYVAHRLKDIERMKERKREEQDFESILKRVIKSGKNPAFDLKLDKDDQEGFTQFKDIIDRLVPKDRFTTFSGRCFNLLDQIPSSEQRIAVYTIDLSTKEEYLDRAKKWKEEKTTGRGATVRSNSAILTEILEFNSNMGFETNIWPVNKNMQVSNFLKLGATGITSDNERILIRSAIILSS